MSNSYSPQTGLFYLVVLEKCSIYVKLGAQISARDRTGNREDSMEPSHGRTREQLGRSGPSGRNATVAELSQEEALPNGPPLTSRCV